MGAVQATPRGKQPDPPLTRHH